MTGSSSISITLTDIWYAWIAFRSGKKPSHAILKFEQNLEANLIRLCYDLNTGAYEHQEYSHKIVNEKKRRDIYVASVRDRVVHRLLYDYLVPNIDPKLDFDVWSCRSGKGLHDCLARTEKLLAKHSTAWVWRADITKFFDSVPHDILSGIVDRHIVCVKTKSILDNIVASYSSQLEVSQSVSQSVSLSVSYWPAHR
ncbi:MAG: RNA-directed polymerase [Patescibacteria group bacterium]|nr:RNA-directed polymerase [Patescibacteria group bacterium]